jgi:hypothetical protein
MFFFLLVLFYFWSAKQRSTFIRALIGASLGLLLPLLFWGISLLIVNYTLLGDPLAPLSGLGLVQNVWPFYLTGVERILSIALYPFAITYNGTFDSLGFISPFFLGFLPYLLIKEVRSFSTFLKEFLWIIAFGSIFVFEVRYVLFLWMLLFLPTAQLLDNAMQVSILVKAGTQVILLALLLFMAVRTLFISLATYSPIVQNDVPQCRDLPMCTFFEPVNQLARPGDRVLVLSAYRYYLRPDLLACSSNKDDYLALEQAALQSPNKFWEEVQRQGYRYIIYDSFYNQYILRFKNLPNLFTSLPPKDIVLYNRTFKDFDLRTITESIYQIEPSPSTSPKISCVLNSHNWQVQSR